MLEFETVLVLNGRRRVRNKKMFESSCFSRKSLSLRVHSVVEIHHINGLVQTNPFIQLNKVNMACLPDIIVVVLIVSMKSRLN